MAFARDVSTASAAQTDFTISFPYILESHVQVFKDGVQQTEGASNDYTIVSGVTVRFNSGLAGGEVIVILRNTSRSTRLVDYVTGATLVEEDLDTDSLQSFYMAQEAQDEADTAMGLNAADNFDAESKLIQNVLDPVSDQDAATKAFVNSVTSVAGNVPVPPAADYLLVSNGATQGDFAWVVALDDAAQIADDLIDSQHYAAGSIDNEHIANNAVSGTKIAFGGDQQGDVCYYDGTDWRRLIAGTTGQIFQTQGVGSDPQWSNGGWTHVSEVATTSGTTVELATSIPAGVTEVVIMLADPGTDTNSQPPLIQLGTSGSYITSGYDCVTTTAAGADAVTNGVQTMRAASYTSGETVKGVINFWRIDGTNEWFFTGLTHEGSGGSYIAGDVDLAAALTRIQVTTPGGAAAFDEGGIALMYR